MMKISATDILNRGIISVGNSGSVIVEGKNVNLSRGGIEVQPVERPTQVGVFRPQVSQLSASEGMRGMMDYYAHAQNTTVTLERLAKLRPAMLGCQHGSAYRGDGAALLRELAATIERGNEAAAASQS